MLAVQIVILPLVAAIEINGVRSGWLVQHELAISALDYHRLDMHTQSNPNGS
jgi:hypothetical protein